MVVAIALAFFWLALPASPQMGTGFSTLDTQAEDKYGDLFAAAGITPEETPYEQPQIEPETEAPEISPSGPLKPQATYEVDACFRASTIPGIAKGDTIIVNVSQINADASPYCAHLDFANITFDCNGSTMTGALTTVGIGITDRNITVVNCEVRRFTNGIIMSTPGVGRPHAFNITSCTIIQSVNAGINITPAAAAAENGTIYNTTITDNGQNGIYVANARRLTIKNSTIANNTLQEILLDDNSAGKVQITGNTLSDPNPTGANDELIDIGNNDNISIRRNRFQDFSSTALFVAAIGKSLGPADNITITNNQFTNINASQTIYLLYIANLTLANNTFGPTYDTTFGGVSEIVLSQMQDSRIMNNTFNQSLVIQFTNDTLVFGNRFYDLDNSTNSYNGLAATSIINLTFERNVQVPLRVTYNAANNCSIINNTFINNGGVVLTNIGIYNNTVSNNRLDPVSVQGTTSAGINFQGPGRVQYNLLANGEMYTILIDRHNVTVSNNIVANTTGDAFYIRGNSNRIFSNTVYNVTGPGFRINGTNNTLYQNNVTFVIVLANTSFNSDLNNVSSPQVPISFSGFIVDQNANFTNIANNRVIALNPSNLLNSLFGVRTRGTTYNTLISSNNFTNLRTAVWAKDAVNIIVSDNNATDCTQRAIIVQNCSQIVTVDRNSLTAPSAAASTNPYEYHTGLYVYRQTAATFDRNNISDYYIGIYLNNATGNTFTNHTITNGGIGIYSLYGIQNNFTHINISNQRFGVRVLYTNQSNFTDVNVTAARTGFSFFQSYFNYLGRCNAPGLINGVEFSHFSANNTADNNNILGSADVDFLFDLFATNNTGAGNGGPSKREENGANNNNVL